MEPVWYYSADGTPVGPVGFAELKAAAVAGTIRPDDLVWRDGTPAWVAARTVPGLLPDTADTVLRAPTEPDVFALEPPPPRPPRPATETFSLDDTEPPPADRPRKPRRPRPAGSESADPAAPGELPPRLVFAKLLFLRAVAPDPTAVAPTADEGAKLTAAGVMDVTARKLAVWRRAVLLVAAVPCAFAAVFGLIDALAMGKDERAMLSGFGILLRFVQAFSLFALPAAAVLGALAYDRLSVSSRWVLAGGLVSLAVPLAVAFTPTGWVLDLDGSDAGKLVRTAAGLALGIGYYLALTPVVLSLLPAVARACVRVKLFLPESLVPGWGLVTSAPLGVLLTLATFVAVYHVAGNLLLLLGLGLWVGAPLVYVARFGLFTRPLSAPADRAEVARASLYAFGLTAAGMFLLVVYLFTAEFAGRSVLGFGSEAVARPWTLDLHRVWIEYVGRSLFLTVFFADLLVRAALSVWREERAFAGSAEAAGFDRTMSGLGSAVLPRGNPVE